jgi:protocatechuate 3,4-dioxygenase beta subunit
MQRTQLIALLVALGLAALAVWWFTSGQLAPVAPPTDTGSAPVASVDPAVHAEPELKHAPDEGAARQQVTGPLHFEVADDPEIRAALTGFRGRVVDRVQKPVADCGVRLYRGAMDSILPPGLDPMADQTTWKPDYFAGETRTGGDGRFLIDKVWPRGLYVMLAGIGTDSPSHRVLTESPAPGEVVDLGDIVLDASAVLTGTVVDDNGKPVADALVRCVDLPGQVLTSFVPIERFDPNGCILVRESGGPPPVIEMPSWVATAFEHLPIPATHSDAQGKFRLVGVVPGTNFVAATQKGRLPSVQPSVKVVAGETKDLGELRLREGDELSGRVLDTAGKPIAGAEVVAGTISTLAPVDFASRIGVTDAEGRFAASGFGPGKVSAAARRTARDPWVLAEPQSILGDVIVKLPSTATLTVRVQFGNEVVREPKLSLIPSRRREEAMIMGMIGFQKPIDLHGRTKPREDGQIEIADLQCERYTLLAQAAGAAVTSADCDLTQGAAHVQVDLLPCVQFVVRCLGPDEAPIRNAAIYVQDRGSREKGGGGPGEMPLLAGRTGADGRFRVENVCSWNLRITAEHPRWGALQGRIEQELPEPRELVLRAAVPGWIEGTLTDGGKPPAIGKYMVGAEWRSQGNRGATESVPALTAPSLDGKFTLRALQPGSYSVAALPSAATLHSPGGVLELMQSAMFGMHQSSQDVEVVAGQGVTVNLDATGVQYDGPVGSLFGTVQVDGRLAVGYRVRASGSNVNRMAIVDAAGRFELRDVPVGNVYLSLTSADGGMFDRQGIWNRGVELAAAQNLEVNIEVATTSLSGICLRPDGSPAIHMHVQVRGQPLAHTDGMNTIWRYVQTDADGRFRVDGTMAGVYRLEVSGNDESPVRGVLDNIRAEGGRAVEDLRLQLHTTIEFSGRVDLTAFGVVPEWAWLTVHHVDPQHPERPGEQLDGTQVSKDGTFKTHVDAGTYRVQVHADVGQKWESLLVPELVEIPAGGMQNAFLRPQREQHPPQGR